MLEQQRMQSMKAGINPEYSMHFSDNPEATPDSNSLADNTTCINSCLSSTGNEHTTG